MPPDLVVGATKFLLIGRIPITATAIGILAANCTLDCHCRRSVGLLRPFRETLDSESGRSSKGSRASVTSSSGLPSFSSRSRIRGSATTAGPRFAPRGQSPCERGFRRTSWGQLARIEWPPACPRRCSPLPARSGVVCLAAEEVLEEAGPGQRHPPVRLRCDLRRPSRRGRRAMKILLIGQMPITATAIGILAGNCTLDCLVAEAGVCSQHSELPMVGSPVAGARCTDPLSRHRAGRLASLPAQESEGQQ